MNSLFTLTIGQAWAVIGVLFVLVVVQYTFSAWMLYKIYRNRRKRESTPLQWCDYCKQWHSGVTLISMHRRYKTSDSINPVVKG